MESQRLGGAESLIRGEAIRFMQQQRSDEQRSKWDMVVHEQNEETSQPEYSGGDNDEVRAEEDQPSSHSDC